FPMRLLRPTDPGYSTALRSLDRHSTPLEEVRTTVEAIVRQVREEGDGAVLALNRRFGGPKNLTARNLRLTQGEWDAACRRVPAPVREAVAASYENVRSFAEKSRRKEWHARNAQGVRVGERFDPFPRVGIYVPGGTAPLV